MTIPSPRARVLAATASLVAVLLVAASGALAATEAVPAPLPAAAPAPPNVLFVTLDTLRRDHVSCYGAERLTTPRLDALAARGVRFSDCISVVPITGPSHASMMTGLYPQVHGAFRNGVPLKPGVPTLAELLAARGYRTGAVVSGWTLKATQCGLARGFESYDDSGMDQRYTVVNLMRRAGPVTDAALAWHARIAAETPDAPWLMFVHYFDPHEPYLPAPPVEPPAPNPAPGAKACTAVHHEQLAGYDREIAYADRELGRLLDGLAARGELEDTLVVVTADHGQSFGEHGYGGPEGAHGRKIGRAHV